MDSAAKRLELVGNGVARLLDVLRLDAAELRGQRLPVGEMEHELCVFRRDGERLVRDERGRRGADEIADHGRASAGRGAVQFLEVPVEGRDARRVVEAPAVVDGGNGLVHRGAGTFDEHVQRPEDLAVCDELRLIRAVDLRVRGVGGDVEIGVEKRHEVGAVQLALGLQRRHGVEVLHHPRREKRVLGDLVAAGELRRVGGELVEGVEHGVEDRPFLGRDLRQRVRERHRVAAPHEAHCRILRHAEDSLGVVRVERDASVDGDFLEQELENRFVGAAAAEGVDEVELRRCVKLSDLAVVVDVRVPIREFAHEGEPLLEVPRVEREAPSAVEKPARVRVRIEGGGLGFGVGAVRRLLVEVRDAREPRQFGGEVALRNGPVDAGLVLELAAAEHVDGGLHELDAARGEGLALAEVLELHVVAHEVRNVLLAAEHVRDRLEEEGAHLVVRRLHFRRAQE